MKKAFLIAVVLALWGAASLVSAGDYLYESDGTLYEIGAPIPYDRCYVYECTAYASGHQAIGLIFYDTQDQCEPKLKITVFENEDLYGWTIEGDWEGNGSYMTAVINFGSYYETFLFLGLSLSSRMLMPQISEFGFNPKVKHPAARVSVEPVS